MSVLLRRAASGTLPCLRALQQGWRAAAGEAVTLLHPPLTLVGVEWRVGVERERQQNGSLAN